MTSITLKKYCNLQLFVGRIVLRMYIYLLLEEFRKENRSIEKQKEHDNKLLCILKKNKTKQNVKDNLLSSLLLLFMSMLLISLLLLLIISLSSQAKIQRFYLANAWKYLLFILHCYDLVSPGERIIQPKKVWFNHT